MIVFFLSNLNNLNAQLLLTTSTDISLLSDISETSKVIKVIPAHKNVQFIDYVSFNNLDGLFKVKVYGIIGYLNRNSIIYDDAFYIAINSKENTININDPVLAEKIYGINKIKINEEKLWAKQNLLENEDLNEIMAILEKNLPVKLNSENTFKNENITQRKVGDFEKKCIQSDESLAYASSLGYSVNTTLSTTLQNTINSEIFSQRNFFLLDCYTQIIDHPYGPHYNPSNRTVVIDKNMINFISNKSFGNERVKAVIAHEFAHALQHANNFYNFYKPGIYPELHADFLAGFYIGRNGLIEKDKLTAFAEESYSVGDNLPFLDPDHHGTPSDRRCAFLEGYKLAVNYDFNIVQAFSAGVDYIKLRYACDPFAIVSEYSKTEFKNTDYTLPKGGYIFSSTQKNIVFCNLYKQPLGEATPEKDLVFDNMTPGNYIVIPAKRKNSGRLKYYNPYTFIVKPNHSGKFTIEKVGIFFIKTYTITF